MNNRFVRWAVYLIIAGLFCWYVLSIIMNKQKERDSDTLLLWIAPGVQQAKFWNKVVDEWNRSGQGLKVEYRTIQTSGSSEESVLNSLVSKTNPDICDNIFSGFGAQLADLNSIYSINDFDGYDKLIKDRKMNEIMAGWAKDGKNYVMPMYSNPVMYWWRGDLLKKFGWDRPPKTYSELEKLAKQVTIPYKRYPIRLFVGRMWNDRWSDYLAYYYAAGNGKPYIENNKAVFNNKYSKEVLDFYKTVFDNKWSLVSTDVSNAFWEGNVFAEIKGAWDIEFAEQTYPEILKNVIVAPVLVPDNHKGPVHTLADTKGLVIFKSCHKPEEAWKFIKYVFSKPEYSKLWLDITGMPPARGDLTTNPQFREYYKSHRLRRAYAENVKYAKPPAPITNTIDVQQAMTNYIMEPLMYGTSNVDDALNTSVKKVDQILEEGNNG